MKMNKNTTNYYYTLEVLHYSVFNALINTTGGTKILKITTVNALNTTG